MYLDTHVAIWIGQKQLKKLSAKVHKLLQGEGVVYLPAMVELELQLLYEVGKIKIAPADIIRSLQKTLNIQSSTLVFGDICAEALKLGWTRDPFDRLIVAEAICNGNEILLTADKKIHAHYKKAIW